MNPFGKLGYHRWIPLLWMLPGLLLFSAFKIFPSFFTGYYSLTEYSGMPGTHATFVGLKNYTRAFASGGWFALGPEIAVTIFFALTITLVQNVGGLALAMVFNRKIRGVSLYRLLIFFPRVLSVVVIGLIWTLLFSPTAGPLESAWSTMIGHTSSFLGSYALAKWIVVLVQAWAGIGFTMLIYVAGLQTIPLELYDAAKVDGAAGWRVFRTVTWPLLAPSATVNIFLSIIGGLHEFAMVYVLTDGDFGTKTLGMAMFSETFAGGNSYGYGAMLQILEFGMVLIVGGVLLWYLRRREVEL